MPIPSQIPECSINLSNHTFNSNSDSNSNSMAISTASTVLASLTEALNLSCHNSMRMASLMFIILVPLEIFSFLIKGSSLFVIDLTALINRSSPEFVVSKTKAEIRLGDLLISILSTILIAQFSCMARSNSKASLDYYIKGLQKIWCGSVAALSCAKLFYMLPVLIITFLERNTRAVQFLQRDKMLVFVLLLKVAWMILLTLVEQWSLVIVLVEGGNGFSAIAKALAFVEKRKGKVFFLMGGITVIKFMAWMLLDFVISDNLKVGKVGLFRLDSIADNTFCYFVSFYTYLLYMVFYEKEK